MRQHRGEEGVSEVVGVMLLVGVTVLAVAIVAVALLSGSPPDEIPHTVIIAGINETGSLVLAHEGGDPLREGEYRIYVENESGFVDGTGDFTEPAGGVWSIGGTLAYNGTGTPERVVVTAVSGGSETILAEPVFRGGGAGFSPDPVEPGVTPAPETTPSSPVNIVNPPIQGAICLETFNCTAKVDESVTRVDLVIYDFDEFKEENKNTAYMYAMAKSSPDTYSKVGDISQGSPVGNENNASITVIAYDGSRAIGYDTIIVKTIKN